MKTEHLNALLIDRALGELPEEVSLLLDSYLEQNPELHVEVNRTHEAVALTGKVVSDRPEIFRAEVSENSSEIEVRPFLGGFQTNAWLKLAALLIALGMAAGAGFVGGSRQSDGNRASVDATNGMQEVSGDTLGESPWARYRIGENGRLAGVSSFEPKS